MRVHENLLFQYVLGTAKGQLEVEDTHGSWLTGRMTILPWEIVCPFAPRCATADIANRAIEDAVSNPEHLPVSKYSQI
jgi:hypothetical protein